MERDRLLNLVEQRRQTEVQGKSVTLRIKISEVAKAVEATLQAHTSTYESPRDIFELCAKLDEIEVPDEITELFRTVRREILSSLLDEMADEKTGPIKRGETDKVRTRESQKQLWKCAGKLVEIFKKLNPETVGPQWIRENVPPELYLELTEAIRHPHNPKLEWEKLIELLPNEWQKKFTKKKKLERESRIEDEIEAYRGVAEMLGAEALAEMLDLMKGKKGKNYGQYLTIVRKFLGKIAPGKFTLQRITELPEEVLKDPDYRKLIVTRLRNHIYAELLDEDGELDREKAKITSIGDNLMRFIKGISQTHSSLMHDVLDEFRGVLNIKSPPRLVNRVTDKEGEAHAFPSLRQRFAMKNIDRRSGGTGKLLVSFFMGGGKTATAFLVKEHVEAKRMLFVCPKPELVTQTAARVSKYYRKEQAPSVGTVVSGMSGEEIKENLEQEVVIVPFTMFNTKVNGGTMVDELKKQGFDMMVVDEVHNARNEDGLYSRSIKELAFGIPGLYDQGHIMLLSGDPIPNTPNDIAAQLGIADRETFGKVESLRGALKKVNPLQLRNKLLDFMLILDPPEQWQEYVETIPLELSQQEMAVYDDILEDDSMQASEKIHRLRMAILNPAMVADSYHGASTMAEAIGERIIDDFEEENVVVFAEPAYKTGVMRKSEAEPNTPTMVDNVKETLGTDCLFFDLHLGCTPEDIQKFAEEAKKQHKTPVVIAIYDGDTPKKEKEFIIHFSKNVEETGVKMAIFAQAGTIREGIDLSHINRAYVLSPEFNQPDLAQFVKRFRREMNQTARIGVFMAPGTILEGIQLHAQQKAILCDSLKYGNVVNPVELRMVDEDDTSVKINYGGVVFGTHFAGTVHSASSKLRKLNQYLNGKSSAEQEELINTYGEKYADLYTKDWEYGESAQTGRLTSAIISDLMAKGILDKTDRIADVGSGPMVLANTLGVTNGRLTIDSYDLNSHMLAKGVKILAGRFGESFVRKAYISKMDQLLMDGVKAEDGHYECVNLGDVLSYTQNNGNRKSPESDERAKVLLEQNRVLKDGGVLIITLPINACSPEEFETLKNELSNFGFEVMEENSGKAEGARKKDNYSNYVITARKTGKPKVNRIRVANLALTPVITSGANARTEDQVINSFQIGDKKIGFTTTFDEQLKNELAAYELEVSKARMLIRQILENKDINRPKLTGEEKKALKKQNIVLTLPEAGINFWKFSLSQKPHLKHKVYEEL